MSTFMRRILPTIELTTSRKRLRFDTWSVVALVEGDRHLGPPQTLWRHGFHHVDLLCGSLPRSLQFLGLRPAEDHETPLNAREGRVVIVVYLVLGRDSLASIFEARQDNLFPHSVLGGDVQELPRRVGVLAAKLMDEHLVGHAVDEGISRRCR